MQRARRLASIPVITAVGVLALTGCRSEPGVAAYVGDTKITEDRVTAIVDDVAEQLGDNAEIKPPSRGVVVSTLVLGEVCKRLNPQPAQPGQPAITPEQMAQALQVPPTTTFAEESARLQTCLMRVRAGAPVTPTAEELAELVRRGREAGAIPAEVTDEQAVQRLDGETLRGELARRNALNEAVADHDVTVNPRYRPLEFPLLRFQDNAAAVGVPLGEPGADSVIDRR
ncbi:hypothetical protein SAMN05444365_103315 [Micromonospora pattaloongensis]|uniref:SurA N-terminal domain-containing protein n=1 Tax=Micromonospora pattaloongensis TaxID=405436 RepID=A0A1H3MDB8_9ACTN|nr:hypothetical protein [Micromonospora pattaloongensis]SDY74169.1 hypothetical protein SAMN05444365_103315 [Micromonospora pattaloongensis]